MDLGYGSTLEKTSDSVALVAAVSLELVGITADKSVEFTYEELAKATNNFSAASKIGQGGFALVCYAELQGQVRIHDLFHSRKMKNE